MDTKVNFTYDKVRHDQDNENHLVISLKAPKKDWEESRPAVCVFPVIDISGSMCGDKIEYAKKSAIKLVEHLKPGDYSGLVVFASHVELISPPVEMTQENKNKLKQRIGDLYATSSTNFSGGMLEGLKQLNDADLPQDMLLRLIMLTDGHANVGVATHYEGLAKLLEQNMGRATVSCFGYGHGADQELLADLAKKGKGNYAFIQNPDDALSAFAKEIGGLLSTHAQNIEIELVAKNGHKIDEVISDVDAEGDDKKVIVKLPEILSEEEQNVVVKVTLSEQSKALPRKLVAFDMNVSYDVVNEDGKLESKSESMKAKVSFVKPGSEQKQPDKRLDEIVGMAQIVKAQIEAEEKAKVGDYQGAMSVMSFMSADLNSRGLEKHAAVAGKLGRKMRCKTSYDLNSAYFQGGKKGMTRSYGLSSMDAEIADDLCGLVGAAAMTNDAMDNVTESFTKDKGEASSAKITIDIDTDPKDPGSILPKPKPDAQITITTKPDKGKKTSRISKKRSKRW